MSKLTELEEIELKYLYAKGFKYIVRHEKGLIEAFKEMPNRNKHGNLYGTWVIGEYPIKDFSLFTELELGKYEFLTWKDEPIEITQLIK